jgi:hypothetical protein
MGGLKRRVQSIVKKKRSRGSVFCIVELSRLFTESSPSSSGLAGNLAACAAGAIRRFDL